MTKEFLSLREISRRLGIPPSTVVYYKDRFSRYIPHEGGRGRRKKYPPEVVTVFKEIREMFNNNWSAEQIEQELSLKSTSLLKGARYDGRVPGQALGEPVNAAAVSRELTAILDRMSDMLQNQTLFRGEIESLRGEIVQLKREKAELEATYKRKLESLNKDVEKLHRERAELMRLVLDNAGAEGSRKTPNDAFLSLPLVIRTQQGEYLGVAGKTKPFSLNEFIALIRKNAEGRKTITMKWRRREGGEWSLQVVAMDNETGGKHDHLLEIFQTVTPSSNNVIQIKRMQIDGNTVPEQFLLVLFRKIKDGFDL